MLIKIDLIKSHGPCKSGLDNLVKHYPNFSGSFDDFLDLERIPYNDKIWLAKKLLNKNQLVHFGLLCAESVLHIFEEKNPEDKRVRDCINYLMKIKDFSNISASQKSEILHHRNAADAAAYDAADAAAAAAAAAAYAAYAAYAYAAYAAYDAAAYAAYDAAYAAYANAASNKELAREQQQKLNLEFLKMAGSL